MQCHLLCRIGFGMGVRLGSSLFPRTRASEKGQKCQCSLEINTFHNFGGNITTLFLEILGTILELLDNYLTSSHAYLNSLDIVSVVHSGRVWVEVGQVVSWDGQFYISITSNEKNCICFLKLSLWVHWRIPNCQVRPKYPGSVSWISKSILHNITH